MEELIFNPEEDGKTHINTYSKASTSLGRSLSNFARTPFIHPIDGYFESTEGYWYFLLTGREHDDLRTVSRHHAKRLGQEILRSGRGKYRSRFTEEDKADFLEALRCKFRQNRPLLNELVNSTLPLVHYQWYGSYGKYKINYSYDYQWVLDEMERIREVCKQAIIKKNNKK